ncbi:MAG TPA: citrate/2-methylcitrate synthase [Chthonomonadales bacterium]|nr:citrate/2-methylcitrate synthase [Chthonomonadales bacterium]
MSEYRPGLEGVVAGISGISEIDEARNELIYRGYDIHDLVDQCAFDEVAYLLLYGDLPDTEQFRDFMNTVGAKRQVPEQIYSLYRMMPADAHPMDTLRSAVSLLATMDEDRADNSRDATIRKAVRLYARIPTLVANGERITQGLQPIEPDPTLCHNANFFHMLKGVEGTGYIGKVFNITQILYAEHGFNASSFSARVTVSTLSDIYSGVTSAIGTLKGPLHGGANEAAMEMLLEIDDPARAAEWVRDALAQKKKIMGFGHREYKHGDERAKIVKSYAVELGEKLGITRWRDMSQAVEDEMMRAKGLYPNLDFPVATVYHLMEIPIPLYTPIFVMSRITGWSAHIMEQLANNRLIRPSSEYNGPRGRKVVPIEERAPAK